jgi:hypothetical protein
VTRKKKPSASLVRSSAAEYSRTLVSDMIGDVETMSAS